MLKLRIIVLLLLLLFVLSIGACSNTDTPATEPDSGEKLPQSSENIINVYLIAGQSNAVGYGMDTGNVIANSDARFVDGFENVLYYGSQERWSGSYPNNMFKPVKLGMGVTADRSGAEIGIASAVADEGGMHAIIKCAQGATHLYPDDQNDVSLNYGTWTSPTYIKNNQVDLTKNPMIGYMYSRFVDTVTNGLRLLIEDGYTPVIKGVWWMQGEAEMFTLPMASAYRELFETLILDTRAMLSEVSGYDCSNVPFVCGLPKWNTRNSPAPTYQGMVRSAMETVAKELNNVGCVDCMPLNQHDDWHFDAAGQKELGQGFISRLEEFEADDDVFTEKLSIESQINLLVAEKGMEFKANLTGINGDNGYEYGFVVVPTAKLTENGIKSQYIEELDRLDIKYEKIVSQVVVEELDEEYSDIYFTGKITDVSYANLNTAYTAIAYVKNAYGEYMYSSAHVSDSVARLASEELYKSGDNTDAIQKLVNAGINSLNDVPEADGEKDTDFELTVDKNLQLNYSQTGTEHQLAVKKSTAVDYFVRFTSDNPDVVSVDENGLLIAKQKGDAVITIECAGKSATVNVSVVQVTLNNGLQLDGVVSKGEYTGDVIRADNGTLFAEISGMIKDNDLYLSFVLTHGPWSPLASDWWMNDNIEFRINGGTSHTVIFREGVPSYSKNISSAVSETVEKDGKLVTTVELCVKGVGSACQLKVGMNGAHFGWLGAIWHDYCNVGYATKDGIIVNKPISAGSNIVLDGNFKESVYTKDVKKNVIRTTANGADVEIMGTLTNRGVLFGVKVLHTLAPDVPTGGNGDWYTFMNIEFHFNDNSDVGFISTAQNTQSIGKMLAYCKSEKTDKGYTSTFEILIPYDQIGVDKDVDSLNFTASGWFENGWCWMLNDSWTASHTVTSNGLSALNK